MNAISFLVMLAALAIILIAVYISNNNYSRRQINRVPPPAPKHQQPSYFNLLDDNGDTIGTPIIKIVIGDGDSDAPVQELQYFCIKDKGYHISVWPKDQPIGGFIEFKIAGISHREGIDSHLGEFVATLEPEPTNPYDANAIKILAPDGHHLGYIPADQTDFVRSLTGESFPYRCKCEVIEGYNDDDEKTYHGFVYIRRKDKGE